MCGARRCSTRPTNNSSSEATWLQFVTRWTRPPNNPVWYGKFAGPVRGVAGPAVPRWALFAGDGRRLAPNGPGANAWPEVSGCERATSSRSCAYGGAIAPRSSGCTQVHVQQRAYSACYSSLVFGHSDRTNRNCRLLPRQATSPGLR